jgi:hypothetical protein
MQLRSHICTHLGANHFHRAAICQTQPGGIKKNKKQRLTPRAPHQVKVISLDLLEFMFSEIAWDAFDFIGRTP